MTIRTRISALLLFAAIMIFIVPANAFSSELIDSLEVTGGVSIAKESPPPFWMDTNRQGRISSESGSSFFTRFRMLKHADEAKEFDWMYGIDVTSRTNAASDFVWSDGYAGLSWKKFRFTAGRKAEFFGLADSLLTAGSEVYSRNAPTIPKIALSTNGFVSITDELAFNAYLAHGWMGKEQNVRDAFLHQKYLYLRFGEDNPDGGVNLFFGVHHLAVWGGTSRSTGFSNPAGFNEFKTIFLGKKGGSNSLEVDQTNALGNHLGSLEYALQLKGIARDWFFYAHTLFEDVSGLWGGLLVKPGDYFLGASMINKEEGNWLKRINIEYLDTRGSVFGEHDDYFYHYQYGSGWTHEGYGIGHPFISFVRGTDFRMYPQNRLQGANASVALAFNNLVNPIMRFAWIRQLGTINEPRSGIDRFAFAFANTSNVSKGWKLNQELFFDAGETMKPNAGMLLSVTKSVF